MYLLIKYLIKLKKESGIVEYSGRNGVFIVRKYKVYLGRWGKGLNGKVV